MIKVSNSSHSRDLIDNLNASVNFDEKGKAKSAYIDLTISIIEAVIIKLMAAPLSEFTTIMNEIKDILQATQKDSKQDQTIINNINDSLPRSKITCYIVYDGFCPFCSKKLTTGTSSAGRKKKQAKRKAGEPITRKHYCKSCNKSFPGQSLLYLTKFPNFGKTK